MPCVCCPKPPENQVAAVGTSQVAADKSSSADPPKPNRMGDRGFDDDKAAVQKWREQHVPGLGSTGNPTKHTTSMQEKQEAKEEERIPATAHHGEEDHSDGSSGDDGSYHLGIDENKQPVKLSPRAVQAWQQKRQEKSTTPPAVEAAKPQLLEPDLVETARTTTSHRPATHNTATSKRSSLKAELRSPYELSSNSGSSQGEGDSRQQQQQQHLRQILNQINPNDLRETSILDDISSSTPTDASPTTTATTTHIDNPLLVTQAQRSGSPTTQRQSNDNDDEFDQLDALIEESSSFLQHQQQQPQEQPIQHHYSRSNPPPSILRNHKKPRIVSPPEPPSPFHHHHHHHHSRQRSSPTRNHHDHEGLKDQMIRDVVLQQQHLPQDGPSSSYHRQDEDDYDDGERLQGQVFLKVNRSPRSSPNILMQRENDTNHYVSTTEDEDDEEETDTDYNLTTETASVSDIFSDPALEDVANSLANDGESRERYILACRLLRTRITQSNPPPIMPKERELLQDLLDRFRSSRTGGSAVAFEALSKILEDDADDDEDEDAIKYQFQSSSYHSSRSYQSALDMDSSRSQDSSLEGKYSVASIREEEEGFNTVLKRHSSSGNSSSWRDEKNSKALPQLLEVENEDDTTTAASSVRKTPDNHSAMSNAIVRLDGWQADSSRDKPNQYPFVIMGLDDDTPTGSRVLTPAIMEALRGFFPYSISEDNFWLRFSMVRDGASLRVLLRNVMACQHTVICLETNEGDVFGSFCSTPWKNNGEQQKWFGTGESFLWKLKHSRYVPEHSADEASKRMHEMEVYPYTGNDDMVQYCTSTTLAVGGGSWKDALCPYPGEPTGIGLLLDGDLEGGETNSCATFANPRLTHSNGTTNEFSIANLEVWSLSPCNTIHLAEQLERQLYFVKEQTLSPQSASSSSPTKSPLLGSPRSGRPPRSPR